MSEDRIKVVAKNRKARHDYIIEDTLEAGITLTGSEIKSIRAGQVNLRDSYAVVRNGELWLINAHIAPYKQASSQNHEPRRERKLLLHRREIRRFAGQASERGLTLVPLKIYFKRGRAKVLMGVCQGRQKHDKREAMKKAEAKRDMQRALRRR